MAPFRECRITPGWESSGDVASTFNIYPSLAKKPIIKTKTGAKTARGTERTLTHLSELKIKRQAEEKKFEVKDSSGIPKLTIEVIRKRYLYPFSINSKIPCDE